MRNRLLGLFAVLGALTLLSASLAIGQTLEEDKISATASVPQTTSLSIKDSGGSGTLALGELTSPPEMGEEYIIVSATSNYASWNLAIYTDNFDVNVDTVAWNADEFGGLVDKESLSTLRLGWTAVDSGDLSPEAAMPGDESDWNWLYDTSDGDGDGSGFPDYGVLQMGWGRYDEWFSLITLEEDLDAPFVFDVYLTTYDQTPPGTYEGTFVVEMFLE